MMKIMSIDSLVMIVIVSDQFCGYIVPTSREAKREKKKEKVTMLSNVMLDCQRPHVFECHTH